MQKLLHLPTLSEPAVAELQRGGDSATWKAITAMVVRNDAQAFQTENGSYLVLSVQKPDLVVLACTGNDAPSLMQTCIELAMLNDCESVRFVTKHKGLPRLLRDFNPVNHGTIYRVQVNESYY